MNSNNIIIVGATIFAGINTAKNYDYIVINDKKIIEIGQGDNWKDYQESSSKVIKLNKDNLIIPGLHDAHLHFLTSALKNKYVDLEQAKSEKEAVALLEKFYKDNPDEEWIFGFNWYHYNWDNKSLPSTRLIDEAIKDKPALMINVEGHGAWVNSRALELAGINKNGPEVYGGTIFRYPDGTPTGYLDENAFGFVASIAMKFDIEKEMEILSETVDYYLQSGITAIQDMRPDVGYDSGSCDTFKRLDEEGRLKLRLFSAANLLDDIDYLISLKDKYDTELYRNCLLKQFVDGVPTMHTAMVLDGYLDKPSVYGYPCNELGLLAEKVRVAHEHGLSVKLHCCGDGAVRKAIDFYEAAIEEYGDTGARHAIEHCELIKDDDLERMSKLGIIASMQPEHMVAMVDTFEENPYLDILTPDQWDRAWRLKSVLSSCVNLALGTDCPVVDIDPFINIYRAVTRKYRDGTGEDGLNKCERLSVEEVLHCYTYVPAYAVSMDKEIGTLEKGKFADITILDRNLLSVDVEEIPNTKVLYTIVNGKIVYEN